MISGLPGLNKVLLHRFPQGEREGLEVRASMWACCAGALLESNGLHWVVWYLAQAKTSMTCRQCSEVSKTRWGPIENGLLLLTKIIHGYAGDYHVHCSLWVWTDPSSSKPRYLWVILESSTNRSLECGKLYTLFTQKLVSRTVFMQEKEAFRVWVCSHLCLLEEITWDKRIRSMSWSFKSSLWFSIRRYKLRRKLHFHTSSFCFRPDFPKPKI